MNNTIAVLVYHKNARKIYPEKWLQEFKHSILHQTYKDFDIIELNYGLDKDRIFEDSFFESVPMPSFVYALNWMLGHSFAAGYQYCFNTNVDDVNTLDRIEKQLPSLGMGYEIVSGNFSLVKNDSVVKQHKFHKLNLANELANNHNPVCHPLVAYASSFWRKHQYVPEQLPLEDMMLWQRAIKDSKMIILEDNLLFHRLHDESVCKSTNR